MGSLFKDEHLKDIVDELRKLPAETGWFEFKENLDDPHEVGEYISALANTAALLGHHYAFIVWGIKDTTHEAVGTSFTFNKKGKGNEDLVPWLTRSLVPQVFFEFNELQYEDKHLVVLAITPAAFQPTRFDGEAYIRSGSYKKNLKGFPEYERKLWLSFDGSPFETGVAIDRQQDEDVFRLLDYSAYFELTDQPLPESRPAVLEALLNEKLIYRAAGRGWRISNLGAILFAKNLADFPTLARKAPRVIVFQGKDKTAAAREQVGQRGYASGFRGLVSYIRDALPAREVFEDGVRRLEVVLPEKAVRELVANALIHQDFSIKGAGPLLEIFTDRIEVTNPGEPLMDPSRLIDAAPQSRNEALASLMRRMGMCEERGSGWDQIAALVESAELPAPLVEVESSFMRVTLFAHRALKQLSAEERTRAIYFHACLQHVRRMRTTNASLRYRFRIAASSKATVSRLIAQAIEAGVIVPHDPSVGAKAMSYVPFWAKDAS